MNYHGLVRAFGDLFSKGENKVGMSEFGGVYTDLTVGLPMAAATKANRVFGATTATATETAPAQAIPTTSAQWFLFNDEPDGGRNYYIDRIGCWSVSGTVGLGMSLLACVSLKRQAIGPTLASGAIITSLSGGPLDTKAIMDSATTITGGTPAWINVGSRSQPAAIEVGAGIVAQVKGAFMVKPGNGLGITVLGPVGTNSKFGVSVVWTEI